MMNTQRSAKQNAMENNNNSLLNSNFIYSETTNGAIQQLKYEQIIPLPIYCNYALDAISTVNFK